jgi:hypothetical protein
MTAIIKHPVVYEAVNNVVTATDISVINGHVIIVKYI